MKEKERHMVNKIQGIFTNLQSARKESRATDILIIEEQMHQLLREWKAELESPATSLNDGSLGSFPGELAQLLQGFEEKDDAISPLTKPGMFNTDYHQNNINDSNYEFYQEKCFDNYQSLGHTFEGSASTPFSSPLNSSGMAQLDFHSFGLNQDMDHNAVGHSSDLIGRHKFCQDHILGYNTEVKNSESAQFNLEEGFDEYDQLFGDNYTKNFGDNFIPNILPNIRPPPSAFLAPKCALWDCFRPAQGLEQCQDYCSSNHELLAKSEDEGKTPILRPGGIDVKDGPLFAAVLAKTLGKEVGIPKCEGAASAKAPWNASELFDISLLEGETVREWLFFDKPRRAFDSGSRKQRNIPDYCGRGWHESRKQVMKEHGGQKRSYYMDPQPVDYVEWHLYEYEINNHEGCLPEKNNHNGCLSTKINHGCALYRLELKRVDKKKSPKVKVTKESLADLQNKMGKLTAAAPSPDDGKSVKGKTEAKSQNIGLPEY